MSEKKSVSKVAAKKDSKKSGKNLPARNIGKLALKEKKGGRLSEYEKNIDKLMSKNINLQLRALDVIERKIEDVSAAQAATIYGILHDKCHMVINAKPEGSTQFNMYFGSGNASLEDMNSSGLLDRVMSRLKEAQREEAAERAIDVGEDELVERVASREEAEEK